MNRTAHVTSLLVGSVLVATVACGSGGSELEQFPTPDPAPSTDDGTTSTGTFGTSGGPTSSSSSGGPATPPCEGLQCKQVACPGSTTTSLSGKVYDPSGTVPLYNAIVYVANAPLEPFKPGIACDKCGAALSGKPIATALTNAKGEFTLKNIPVGADFPLVVQVGRWRRQVTIPAVTTQCVDTPVDAAKTRLPRNKSEGDIPKIAITTGNADSLECFLRKIGIEDAEITNPTGTGRVHLYQGRRGSSSHGSRIDASTPSGQSLWDDAAKLKDYDMLILSCEGNENNTTKSDAAKANLRDYLDAGGRVFASHFHYTWFKNGPTDVASTATWVNNGDVGNRNVSVDTSFEKGKAFSEWLVEVNASTTPGIIPMTELRRNVTTVPGAGAAANVSRRWLYDVNGASEEAKFYSFNTPIAKLAAEQCGRGVYTDIHVSSGDGSGGTFPANCTTTGLTAQEKALLFLLFDLASCIQDESKPPAPPPVVPPVVR